MGLISDSYDLKTVDGVAYEADCAKITIGGETFDTGANASAEGGDDEGADDQKETKIDVVHSFRLQETSFDKKIIANFGDYEFLIGESMDPDAMVVLLNYREDGVTPYVTLWKHGLKETKV